MHYYLYYVLQSQNSHQNVSADIPGILSMMLLYNNTKIEKGLTVSPSLHNN